ncbi:MAG: SDR family oxidoreductase [Alphaproteobacteria bacterium]|nr:SDR family oxidoreductase [Alphaproteobacteria bacterium]
MQDHDYDDVFSDPGYADLPAFHDLTGKSVFITGGGSGIGAFLTAAFALQGAKVGFISLSEAPATRLCDSVEAKTGHRPIAIQGDIRNVETMQAAIHRVAEAHGAIDILINNAARDTRHTVEDWSVENWDDSIATNLRPCFFAAQSVAGGMKENGAGAIINVGSNSWHLGLSGYPTYVAAKAAIAGMTKALARELGENGIRVNSLVPGWVLTERQKRLWANEKDVQDCLAQQSLKATLGGWDMAGPALFLASQASAMMTGQELIVDGGRC